MHANLGGLNAHVRMSEDAPGEELAPDATIWKMYVEEATEQDHELANAQNKNLDLMLLFATLFSAILTAFLIEAKKLLEEDPAETSAALLLLVAQSQQRIELGIPTSNHVLIQRTAFVPSKTARYVNGLWFVALALSLAAALVAMLAKEWLGAFVSSTVRPAYDYALQRQAKYNGLIFWRALYIIACLPSLLHLALLLFALGLVLYLWNLDETIAIIVGVVTGTTLLLYMTTTILGAIFESCPFVTNISGYIRMVYSTALGEHRIFHNRLSSSKIFHHSCVSKEALEALGWLATSSRDPAVSNSAYQALAGFTGMTRLPKSIPSGPHLSVGAQFVGAEAELDAECFESEPEIDTNFKFLCAICHQFADTATHKHREVEACLGSNLARYAAALPSLATHIETFRQSKLLTEPANIEDKWKSRENSFELALATIDRVWNNDCAPLSPDTYAIITASELQLTANLTSLDTVAPFNTIATSAHMKSSEEYKGHITLQPLNYHVLEARVSPARCNRSLARASVLLRYHNSGQALMSYQALFHLMNSISSVAACEQLVFDSDLELNVHVVGRGIEDCPNPNLFDHPQGIFRQLLKTWDLVAMPGTWSKLEHNAAMAVSSFAHHFLRQWMGYHEIRGPQSGSRNSSYRRLDFELPLSSQDQDDKTMFNRALENWPDHNYSTENIRPSLTVLSRLLLISVIVILQTDPLEGDLEFPASVLRSVWRAATPLSGQRQLYNVVVKHKALIRRLIELVDRKFDPNLGQNFDSQASPAKYLVQFLALSFERRTLISYCGLDSAALSSVLRIASTVSELATETELILDDMIQQLQDGIKEML